MKIKEAEVVVIKENIEINLCHQARLQNIIVGIKNQIITEWKHIIKERKIIKKEEDPIIPHIIKIHNIKMNTRNGLIKYK